MQAHKLLIIGLGRIGTTLLQRLSRDFEITCIDIDPRAGQKAREDGRPDVKIIAADATSRLVLEESGAREADTIIVTLTEERVNLEVCRVLHEHFSGKRVIAVGITPKGIKTLESYDAEVENIFNASVVGILNQVEQKSRAVHGIGLGKNEIREVEIHPHSKLADKPLTSIASLKWRVGLIYREGRIIVPGGETILKPRDRIIILGEPGTLNSVSDILTFRFQNFPLEYGSRILACVDGNETDPCFDEIRYILQVFNLTGITLAGKGSESLLSRVREKCAIEDVTCMDTPLAGLPSAISRQERYGFIVIPQSALQNLFPFYASPAKKKRFLSNLSRKALSPVLITRGTFPYKRAASACIDRVDVTHVMENVLEMTSLLNNQITALVVRPSPYIDSEEQMDRFEVTKKNIRDLSNIYKLSVSIDVLEGNPVKAIKDHLHSFNLLLTDTSWKVQGRLASLTSPDSIWDIITGAPITTLLIPEAEESF